MIKGAKELGPIAGGADKNNGNYRIARVILPAEGIDAISDSSMAFLSENLPFLIVQNDRDAVGSKGQNKLNKDNKIAGIDYGHAYQSFCSLLEKMTADFHILDKDFKNYSVFYDTKRSDIIRGLIKVAVLSGAKVDEQVLASYGSDFLIEIKRIIPHIDEKIFDDYINKFTELATRFQFSDKPAKIKNENILCCKEIVKKLVEAKQWHIKARDEMLAKFAFYLTLDANAVDLLDCIDKLTTPKDDRSLRSPNGTVLLNHIRVSAINRQVWEVKTGYQGRHTFTGTFDSQEQADHALSTIKSMLPANADFVALAQNGKTVTMVFDKLYLTTLANIFKEDKIIRKLFPDDAALSGRFQAEQSLLRLFETFKPFGVQAELKAAANQQYALSFAAIPPDKMDPAFQAFLRKVLKNLDIKYFDAGDKISFTITPNLIETLEEKLNVLAHDALSMKQSQVNFSDMAEIIRHHPQIGQHLVLILDDKHDGFSLELINCDPTSKDAERCWKLFEMLLRREFKQDNTHFAIPYEKLSVLNRLLQDGIGKYDVLSKMFASAQSVRANSVFSAVSSSPSSSLKSDSHANRR